MRDFWPPKSHQKRLGALSARAQRPQTLCAHIFISFSLRRRGAVITWLIDAPSVQCREQARCSANVHRADLATATQMTGATGRVRDGLSHLRGHSIPAVLGTFAAQKYRQVQDRQSPALLFASQTPLFPSQSAAPTALPRGEPRDAGGYGYALTSPLSLAAARSRCGSDMPPACHSLPRRHFVTSRRRL